MPCNAITQYYLTIYIIHTYLETLGAKIVCSVQVILY